MRPQSGPAMGRLALAAALLAVVSLAGTVAAQQAPALPAASTSPNPSNPFAFAMGTNEYITRNFFIGAYHYVQCFGGELVVPDSTAQVAQAVAYWHKRAQSGTAVTLRASRPMFHSSATFPCPTPPTAATAAPPGVVTEQGSRAVSVGLMQHKLNKVIAKDDKASTMRVGAGMLYAEFLKEAEKARMSVQIGTVPVYAGLTLAGVLATTAHGSGYKAPSAIWDTLLEVMWVDGTGKVHVSKPTDLEFKAMVGGLGVFGVITEVLMQMTPLSATTLTTIEGSDKNLMADVQRLLKDVSPHMLLLWRPDVFKYRAYLLTKAKPGAKVESNTVATLLPSYKGRQRLASAVKLLSTMVHDDKDAQEYMCGLVAEASVDTFWASTKREEGTGLFNVTGSTNAMQASECDEHCSWNDPIVTNGTAQDVEFTIEWEQLSAWIADVKRIIQKDLFEDGKAPYRCMGPGYIWLRFGTGLSGGLTATVADMKDPVFVQSTWMRSRAALDYPTRYQFVQDLIEELTLCKYNGRPHWGKNFDRTFTHPKCGVRAKYPKFAGLLGLQKKYDPSGMFEPRLFRMVAEGQSYKLTKGCSTWMQCYCQTDANCPVEHKCVPALSFPEYKVCKPDMSEKPGTIMPKMLEEIAAAGRR